MQLDFRCAARAQPSTTVAVVLGGPRWSWCKGNGSALLMLSQLKPSTQSTVDLKDTGDGVFSGQPPLPLWERIEVRGITPIPTFPHQEGRGFSPP